MLLSFGHQSFSILFYGWAPPPPLTSKSACMPPRVIEYIPQDTTRSVSAQREQSIRYEMTSLCLAKTEPVQIQEEKPMQRDNCLADTTRILNTHTQNMYTHIHIYIYIYILVCVYLVFIQCLSSVVLVCEGLRSPLHHLFLSYFKEDFHSVYVILVASDGI